DRAGPCRLRGRRFAAGDSDRATRTATAEERGSWIGPFCDAGHCTAAGVLATRTRQAPKLALGPTIYLPYTCNIDWPAPRVDGNLVTFVPAILPAGAFSCPSRNALPFSSCWV